MNDWEQFWIYIVCAIILWSIGVCLSVHAAPPLKIESSITNTPTFPVMHAPPYFCVTDYTQFDSEPQDGATFFTLRKDWMLRALTHQKPTFERPLKIIRVN